MLVSALGLSSVLSFQLHLHREQPGVLEFFLQAQCLEIFICLVFVGELHERDAHAVVAFYERGLGISHADVLVQCLIGTAMIGQAGYDDMIRFCGLYIRYRFYGGSLWLDDGGLGFLYNRHLLCRRNNGGEGLLHNLFGLAFRLGC